MHFDMNTFECITSLGRLREWLKYTDEASVICYDTETTGLNVFEDVIVGHALAVLVGDRIESCYIPTGHTTADVQMTNGEVLFELNPLLESANRSVVMHNALFDMLMLSRHGVEVASPHDTMLMSYALSGTPHEAFSHGMDALALRELGHNTIKYKDVVLEKLGHRNFGDVSLSSATRYSAEDTAVTLMLFYILETKLHGEGLYEVYTDIDLPLLRPLRDMKLRGVEVDVIRCHELTAEWEQVIAEVQARVDKSAGRAVKLGSPKDLSKLLFDELKMEPAGRTDSGAPSTAKDELELMEQTPLIKDILEWRKFSKLVSTYTKGLPTKVQATTGRVHPNFPQTRTVTGRFASNDPNLQQIPTRSKEGAELRKVIVAPQGFLIGGADYSQIELRVAGHMSGDKTLLQAYRDNLDIHQLTASKISKVPFEAVTKSQRNVAKTANFLSLYGGWIATLARKTGISLEEAEDFLYAYWEMMEGFGEYIDDVKAQARTTGYAETLFGRRVELKHITSGHKGLRGHAERLSVSVAIQGTAADLMRLAIPPVHKYLDDIGGHLLATVHDELLFEFPEDCDPKRVCDEVAGLMGHAADHLVDWRVPIIAEAGFGKTWSEAK